MPSLGWKQIRCSLFQCPQASMNKPHRCTLGSVTLLWWIPPTSMIHTDASWWLYTPRCTRGRCTPQDGSCSTWSGVGSSGKSITIANILLGPRQKIQVNNGDYFALYEQAPEVGNDIAPGPSPAPAPSVSPFGTPSVPLTQEEVRSCSGGTNEDRPDKESSRLDAFQ